jgi:hypothetical protein
MLIQEHPHKMEKHLQQLHKWILLSQGTTPLHLIFFLRTTTHSSSVPQLPSPSKPILHAGEVPAPPRLTAKGVKQHCGWRQPRTVTVTEHRLLMVLTHSVALIMVVHITFSWPLYLWTQIEHLFHYYRLVSWTKTIVCINTDSSNSCNPEDVSSMYLKHISNTARSHTVQHPENRTLRESLKSASPYSTFTKQG